MVPSILIPSQSPLCTSTFLPYSMHSLKSLMPSRANTTLKERSRNFYVAGEVDICPPNHGSPLLQSPHASSSAHFLHSPHSHMRTPPTHSTCTPYAPQTPPIPPLRFHIFRTTPNPAPPPRPLPPCLLHIPEPRPFQLHPPAPLHSPHSSIPKIHAISTVLPLSTLA